MFSFFSKSIFQRKQKFAIPLATNYLLSKIHFSLTGFIENENIRLKFHFYELSIFCEVPLFILEPTVLFMLPKKKTWTLEDATACFSLNFQQALHVKIWIMNKHRNTGIFIKEKKKSIVELMRRIRKHLTVVTIERGFLWRLM